MSKSRFDATALENACKADLDSKRSVVSKLGRIKSGCGTVIGVAMAVVLWLGFLGLTALGPLMLYLGVKIVVDRWTGKLAWHGDFGEIGAFAGSTAAGVALTVLFLGVILGLIGEFRRWIGGAKSAHASSEMPHVPFSELSRQSADDPNEVDVPHDRGVGVNRNGVSASSPRPPMIP